MTRAGVVVLAAALLGSGCVRDGDRRAGAGGVIEEARALIDQGDYDGALARLGGGTDAESLYLLGRAWAGKAAGTTPAPDGSLGSEEVQALDFLEQAVAAEPNHAEAHLAIGNLLAPHVRSTGGVEGATGTPVATSGSGVGADRVLEAYGAAVQADPADTASVEALIQFATRVGRPREARGAFQELTRRDRENPDVLVRFGDFLTGPGQDPEAALGVYAQALIWRPDDSETRLKVADVHLEAARGHVERREFVAAEARLREARKFVVDPASPQARTLREVANALADASGRR
jgi:tetratricopeptide (TPR) repeat protein